MSDTMKALDEIEVALSEAAKWVRGDYASFCRDAMLRTLALLPTLRAALTPPADDEVEAIRGRWQADEEQGFPTVSAFRQGHLDVGTLLRHVDRLSAELAKERGWRGMDERPPLDQNVIAWRDDAGAFEAIYTSLSNFWTEDEQELSTLTEEEIHERDWWGFGPYGLHRLEDELRPQLWRHLPAPPATFTKETP